MGHFVDDLRWVNYLPATLQRSPLFCANIVKKDLGRARQNNLATAGTNFTKPGAQNIGDLCSCIRLRQVVLV